MDAGLAAVLGAAVGAVGTGGAGVIAALLARSQARSQILAEHVRLIREPRKATYVAFVEACREEHDRLDNACQLLDLHLNSPIVAVREERYEGARNLYDASTEARRALKHLEAQVYIEGPPSVISAAVDLSASLTDFRHEVLDVMAPDASGTIEAMEAARTASYEKYLDFLYRASEAVGADGLQKSPK
ncbi:hypothetical protein [Streptomyces hyderabadensis]|uniref:Secreted protein n=1 Tax=Streptomyces hyderabadensis TaxID=598549 RepID=A0ABP9I9X2_9ACTN|nr:hypothetical protein [Streptomyces hyderabadensis]